MKRFFPRSRARWLGLACLAVTLTGSGFCDTIKEVRKKMGSRFELTVVHEDRAVAEAAVEAAYAEIDRLEQMISSWSPASETSRINLKAGLEAVPVSSELFFLIGRALKVSQLTNGFFDISFAAMGHLWNFKADPPVVPDSESIEAALGLVDYRKILLDASARTVFLEAPGMRIGFGAIGKGFAANQAVKLLKSMGIKSGVVNAGGDLLLFGRQENGDPWSVAIADPRNPDHVFLRLHLTDHAIVTSGDYESYFFKDGKRYSHIINPKTGYPASQLQSVTILCPDAELADALATAVFVMGPVEGMELVNRLKNVECLMVDAEGHPFYSNHVREKSLLSEEH